MSFTADRLLLFGATGDLAQRMLLPSLCALHADRLVADDLQIIGTARQDFDDAGFRNFARAALEKFLPADRRGSMATFLNRLRYQPLDATNSAGYEALAGKVGPIQRGLAIFLSTAPSLFEPTIAGLTASGLTGDKVRIGLEKPLGTCLASSREINDAVARAFPEERTFRIDHYLGKETVQNLLALRFANILFEPLWNSQYVDHVQITVAETVGVGGRGAYYDKSGAMRDMVQNHLMQLLCLIAMEPPYHFDPNAVRDEKLKVIRALEPLRPDDIVRGQYTARDGEADYRSDAENPDSTTESYIALRVHVQNWRWKGTPFYLRTGKKLRARASEIAVVFREPPHSIFDDVEGWRENQLVIRLQPNEGMDLKVMIKEPGPGGMRLVQVPLDMSFADALGAEGADIPDAYERLIMDVIRGNQTLFMRGDEVEAAWAWVDPAIAAWEEAGTKPQVYDPGSSGPDEALALLHRDGRRWREIKP